MFIDPKKHTLVPCILYGFLFVDSRVTTLFQHISLFSIFIQPRKFQYKLKSLAISFLFSSIFCWYKLLLLWMNLHKDSINPNVKEKTCL